MRVRLRARPAGCVFMQPIAATVCGCGGERHRLPGADDGISRPTSSSSYQRLIWPCHLRERSVRAGRLTFSRRQHPRTRLRGPTASRVPRSCACHGRRASAVPHAPSDTATGQPWHSPRARLAAASKAGWTSFRTCLLTSPLTESNRRPSPYHGDALPTELRGRLRRSRLRLPDLNCRACRAYTTRGEQARPVRAGEPDSSTAQYRPAERRDWMA